MVIALELHFNGKLLHVKKMGEFGGQNAHSTLNTDCESGV